MSDNSFSEISSQSWFSRLGGAIKGIFIGLLMFVASFPLIIWNENRAVDTTVGLEQAESLVIAVQASPVKPENDGKLVYFTADASTDEILQDSDFGVSLNAIKLFRSVLMYQWEEISESKTEKKLGGGTETVTTYTYNKVWTSELIDSRQFKKASEYVNPRFMAYSSNSQTAQKVMAGDYRLPPLLLERWNNPKALDISNQELSLPEGFRSVGGTIYSSSAATDEIGDLQIIFLAISPGAVSVVAQQIGQTLEAFATKSGTSVAILEPGTHGAANLFQQAHASNSSLTWILRLLAFVLMAVGIGLVLNPIKIFADVVPFLGTVVGMGTGMVAGLVALALTSVTVALVWVLVRPLLALLLLVIAGAAVYVFKTQVKKHPAAASAPDSIGGAA